MALLACACAPLAAQTAVRAGAGPILAQGGVARRYPAQAGLASDEVLGGVYKSFGLSPDSRSFLYLKAEGGFPTFDLYIHDFDSGDATRVTERAVHNAAWSPDGKTVAYLWLDSAGQSHVSLYDVARRESSEIGSGRMKMDFLEWAQDSAEVLYLTVAPRGGDAFETGEWDSTLNRFSIRLGTTQRIPGVEWAQFSDGQLVVAGHPVPPQYRSIPNPKEQKIDRFLIRDGQIYANLRADGKEVISRWDSAAGSYQTLTSGRLLAATGSGVLIRDFSTAEAAYSILGGPRLAPAGANWRLPYYGLAAMVQGGSGYSGGACDGVACQVVAHTAMLNFALDFQQVSEANEGNQHILAVESGTVVSLYNSLTCGVSTTCTTGSDTYTNPCSDPNSGAGNHVVLAHLDGSYSLYAHLRSGSIPLKVGQTVGQGAFVGEQGHSGSALTPNNYRSCGDHLHYQRQTTPGVWSQSIPTDFEDTPCLMACSSVYPSKNVELAPAPALTAMQPALAMAGSSVTVALTGSDFLYGTTLAVSGAGVTAGTVLVSSATQASVTLTVAPGAVPGLRDVTVTTARGVSAPFRFNISVPVTAYLATQPPGMAVTADGTACLTPCVLSWNSGTVHTIAAPATVAGTPGMRFGWQAWSDGGALMHTVTAPISTVTYTASYGPQYLLTTSANPPGAGTVAPVTAWYDSGSSIAVSASASSGLTFSGFSGALTGAITPQPVTVTGPLSVTANFNPHLSLSRTSLNLGATAGRGSATSPQEILVGGTSSVSTWTAVSGTPWLSVAPASGLRGGRFAVSIVASAVPPPGSYTGKITVTGGGAYNGSLVVNCVLTVRSGTSAPYGAMDTPAEGVTGLAGSVPVTGWALDDIGVRKVTIWRDPVGPEPLQPNGLIYIGDAVFVAGARPDVESTYSGAPNSYRAGWGYLMLSNTLPGPTGSNGNGVYRIHAIALDEEGNQTKLGARTVTVDNRSSVKPFGTIDSPAPGEIISGSSYVNNGWALTPRPATIPFDGSTVWVNIDGVSFAHPVFNLRRGDIASVFPTYANSLGAGGTYLLDTTKYANGMHAISWVIYDNLNHGEGVGSRYIEIQNALPAGGRGAVAGQDKTALLRAARMRRAAPPMGGYPAFRTGWDPDTELVPIRGAGGGLLDPVHLSEMDRIEIHLPAARTWSAGLRFGGDRRELPIGSTFDSEGGIFYWQLGAGFLGRFQLEFTSADATSMVIPVDVITRQAAAR